MLDLLEVFSCASRTFPLERCLLVEVIKKRELTARISCVVLFFVFVFVVVVVAWLLPFQLDLLVKSLIDSFLIKNFLIKSLMVSFELCKDNIDFLCTRMTIEKA